MSSEIGNKSTSTISTKALKVIARWCIANWRKILAEFLATTSLVLFGCMGSCKFDNNKETPAIFIPLAFGIVIAINLQIFGHISGAHMNPVISLGAFIFGRISFPLTMVYMIVQCFGAICGFGLLIAIIPSSLKPDAMCTTYPRSELNTVEAIGIEMLLSAALILICCGLWDSRNKNNHDSISIRFGLMVTGLAMAGGHLSGASMNPARSLGPAVWNNTWDYHWIYWIGPFIGGAISSTFYSLIWKNNDTDS